MSETSGIELPTREEILEANEPKQEPTLFRKVGTRLMRTGQIAVLATVLSTSFAACARGESNIYPQSSTPGIERTKTETTKRPIEPTNTPLPLETPETTSQDKTIVILGESLTGKEGEILPYDITVEEYKAKVEEISKQILPQNKDRKIIIDKSEEYPGHNYFDNTTPERIMHIDIATSPESLPYVIAHEDGHDATNVNYWLYQAKISPEDYNLLVETIEKAKLDPEFGLPEQFDAIADFFTQKFITAKNTPRGQAEGEILAAKIKYTSESFMLWGRLSKNHKNQLDDLIQKNMDSLIANTDLEVPESAKNMEEVLSDPAILKLLEQEAQNNPVFAYALKKIKEHAPLLNETQIHTESSPIHIAILGNTKHETLVNLKFLATAEIQNGIRTKDPTILAELQKLGILDSSISYVDGIDTQARSELAADQYSTAVNEPEKLENPGVAILNLVKNF